MKAGLWIVLSLMAMGVYADAGSPTGLSPVRMAKSEQAFMYAP